MKSLNTASLTITPKVLLKAYSCGIFPMAESADDDHLYWIEPQHRGVLPIDRIHLPKRLRRTLRQDRFEVRIDSDYDGVIDGCAASRPDRQTTWINGRIRSLYRELFEVGHCHTVEAWSEGLLVGGLYGVELGGAFFGESMFSHERDASKVALAHLAARLLRGGFTLLDTQFVTEHLRQFGTVEIGRDRFQELLKEALGKSADFAALRLDATGAEVIEIIESAARRSWRSTDSD